MAISNQKILIAGAGIGGIVAAARLANAGFDVELYEQQSREQIGYDWTDDFDIKIMEELDIPQPDPSSYFIKPNWIFISPNKRNQISTYVPDEENDVSIERKPLIQTLLKYAEQNGAKLFFNTPVLGPHIKDDKILGLIIDKNRIVEGNLVIDALGLNSIIRKNLPDSFNITKDLKRGESFYVWRAYYNKIGEQELTGKAKVYFLHMGHSGISWVVHGKNNTINVLIGQIDPLSDSDVQESLIDLRKDNPELGEKVLRGGMYVQIPIRRPLMKMVHDNYAAVGDSAFMTIPIMGSGIHASIAAGYFLAETIKNSRSCDNPFCLENLWNYQLKFFREFGAKFTSIELMKNMMLSLSGEEVDFLMEKGIITAKDLAHSSKGSEFTIKIGDLIVRAIKGIRKLNLMLKIKNTITKMKNVKGLGLKIPQNYEVEQVNTWISAMESFFK